MIEVEGVVYDYPSARALFGVSFTLEPGVVLAFVGPNGAGKTTLMRCMAALDAPAEGRITIDGFDTRENPREVHAAIGYLPDFYGLYEELTVRRALTYAARSRGVAVSDTDEAVERAAARVQLTDRMEQRAGTLSRGLKQRLAIGQTIVHSPKVLLLDEPAAGLDPEARRALSDLIVRLSGEGMTIVVSSHILSELEDYSTRMLMIRDGRIAGGGVVEAGVSADAGRVAVAFVGGAAAHSAQLAAAGAEVERLDGDEAILKVTGGPEGEAALLAKLVQAGLPVRGFTASRRSLEATYLATAKPKGAA